MEYSYQMQLEQYNRSVRKDSLILGVIALGQLGVSMLITMIISSAATALSAIMNNNAAADFLLSADGLMIISVAAGIFSNGVFPAIFYLPRRKEAVVEKKKAKMGIILPLCALLMLQVNLLVSCTDYVISELIGFAPNGDVNAIVGDGSFWMMLITVGIVGPIFEEFAFRKVIFSIGRKHGFCFAAITSSVLFSLMHQNVTQFLFAFLIGLILAYIYEKSGKLIYPIILHVLNNSYSVVLSFIPFANWVYIIIDFLLLASFAVMAIRFLVKKKTFSDLFPGRGDEGFTIKTFFTRPTVIIFIIVCILTALITMVMPSSF